VRTLPETPLNTDFNNERQNCKLSTVQGGVVNGGDEGEGIWLMGFTYIYKIER
jgi:hypothetical protein